MEDPTTIALNLTFFGTLGVAFLMFLGLFLIFMATLVLAGVGRLLAVALMAVFSVFRRRPAPPAGLLPLRREPPRLAEDWNAAVARADARQDAREGKRSA